MENSYYPPSDEDEIDLMELWQTIAKRKKLVIFLTTFVTVLAIIISLLKPNIYKSDATILPTKQRGGGAASLSSQFGRLASLAGVSMPSGAYTEEIMAILKSKILKKEVIEKYHLLPIILYKQWDEKHRKWKKGGGIVYDIKKIIGLNKKINRKKLEEIRMAEAIKSLSSMMDVNEDKKIGTIDISVEYPDPKISAEITQDILNTLRNKMTSEAIKIASRRKTILEKELIKTPDPTIQHEIYSLIAKQAGTIATAKVSEGFAFKVINPPMVPVFKYKPKRKLIVIVAFITGLILSIFLVFFIEFIGNAKKRLKELEE